MDGIPFIGNVITNDVKKKVSSFMKRVSRYRKGAIG